MGMAKDRLVRYDRKNHRHLINAVMQMQGKLHSCGDVQSTWTLEYQRCKYIQAGLKNLEEQQEKQNKKSQSTSESCGYK